MKTFDDISSARAELMDFRAGPMAGLRPELKTRLDQAITSPSPVDQIVTTMEVLYANPADLTDDSRALIGGLAAFATTNAWHGLLDDNRGIRIVQAMRRDLKEAPVPGIDYPAADTDPAAKSNFVVEAPKPVEEPAAS